ncbi:MAG: hypothetical protein WEB60_07820 [Terrimicrobiaceae bacterium]
MVEGVEKVTDSILHNLEVADHAIGIEVVRLEDDLNLPAMPVREAAFVRVMREHVPVFNLDCLADAVGHSGSFGVSEEVDVEA